MTDLSDLSAKAVEVIRSTPEYIEYKRLLTEVRKEPALYERINGFRARNLEIQMNMSEDAYDKLDALTNEYEDVINRELATEFLEAEAAFCMLVQEFNSAIGEGLEFD